MKPRARPEVLPAEVDCVMRERVPVPSGDAHAYYQCDTATPPSCNLMGQLRSGVHVELLGGGTSGRRDVDDLAAGLP